MAGRTSYQDTAKVGGFTVHGMTQDQAKAVTSKDMTSIKTGSLGRVYGASGKEKSIAALPSSGDNQITRSQTMADYVNGVYDGSITEKTETTSNFLKEAEGYYNASLSGGDTDSASYWMNMVNSLQDAKNSANNSRYDNIAKLATGAGARSEAIPGLIEAAQKYSENETDEARKAEWGNLANQLKDQHNFLNRQEYTQYAEQLQKLQEEGKTLQANRDNANRAANVSMAASSGDSDVIGTYKDAELQLKFNKTEQQRLTEAMAALDTQMESFNMTPEVQAAIERLKANGYTGKSGRKQHEADRELVDKFYSGFGMNRKDYNTGDRARSTIAAGLETVGEGFSNLGAVMSRAVDYGMGVDGNVQGWENAGYATDELSAANLQRETNYEQNRSDYTNRWEKAGGNDTLFRYAAEDLEKVADSLHDRSASDLAAAKADLGKMGQFMVDAGHTIITIGADVALAPATGGSSLVPMFLRTFGSSAAEARRSGASFGKQIGYGALNASVETITEKMFGAFDKLGYGKGFLPMGGIEKALRDSVKSDAGKYLMTVLYNSVEEGMEEVFSDLAAPFGKWIIDEQSRGHYFSEIEISELFRDFLLGASLGGMGAVTVGSGQTVRTIRGENMANLAAISQKQARGETLTSEEQMRLANGNSTGGLSMRQAGELRRGGTREEARNKKAEAKQQKATEKANRKQEKADNLREAFEKQARGAEKAQPNGEHYAHDPEAMLKDAFRGVSSEPTQAEGKEYRGKHLKNPYEIRQPQHKDSTGKFGETTDESSGKHLEENSPKAKRQTIDEAIEDSKNGKLDTEESPTPTNAPNRAASNSFLGKAFDEADAAAKTAKNNQGRKPGLHEEDTSAGRAKAKAEQKAKTEAAERAVAEDEDAGLMSAKDAQGRKRKGYEQRVGSVLKKLGKGDVLSTADKFTKAEVNELVAQGKITQEQAKKLTMSDAEARANGREAGKKAESSRVAANKKAIEARRKLARGEELAPEDKLTRREAETAFAAGLISEEEVKKFGRTKADTEAMKNAEPKTENVGKKPTVFKDKDERKNHADRAAELGYDEDTESAPEPKPAKKAPAKAEPKPVEEKKAQPAPPAQETKPAEQTPARQQETKKQAIARITKEYHDAMDKLHAQKNYSGAEESRIQQKYLNNLKAVSQPKAQSAKADETKPAESNKPSEKELEQLFTAGGITAEQYRNQMVQYGYRTQEWADKAAARRAANEAEKTSRKTPVKKSSYEEHQKALYDAGNITAGEYYNRLVNHGLMTHDEAAKKIAEAKTREQQAPEVDQAALNDLLNDSPSAKWEKSKKNAEKNINKVVERNKNKNDAIILFDRPGTRDKEFSKFWKEKYGIDVRVFDLGFFKKMKQASNKRPMFFVLDVKPGSDLYPSAKYDAGIRHEAWRYDGVDLVRLQIGEDGDVIGSPLIIHGNNEKNVGVQARYINGMSQANSYSKSSEYGKGFFDNAKAGSETPSAPTKSAPRVQETVKEESESGKEKNNYANDVANIKEGESKRFDFSNGSFHSTYYVQNNGESGYTVYSWSDIGHSGEPLDNRLTADAVAKFLNDGGSDSTTLHLLYDHVPRKSSNTTTQAEPQQSTVERIVNDAKRDYNTPDKSGYAPSDIEGNGSESDFLTNSEEGHIYHALGRALENDEIGVKEYKDALRQYAPRVANMVLEESPESKLDSIKLGGTERFDVYNPFTGEKVTYYVRNNGENGYEVYNRSEPMTGNVTKDGVLKFLQDGDINYLYHNAPKVGKGPKEKAAAPQQASANEEKAAKDATPKKPFVYTPANNSNIQYTFDGTTLKKTENGKTVRTITDRVAIDELLQSFFAEAGEAPATNAPNAQETQPVVENTPVAPTTEKTVKPPVESPETPPVQQRRPMPQPSSKKKESKQGFRDKSQTPKTVKNSKVAAPFEFGKYDSASTEEVSRVADYRIEQNGYEAEIDRLNNQENWDRTDFAEAQRLIHQRTKQIYDQMTSDRGLVERGKYETEKSWQARCEARYQELRAPIDELLETYRQKKSDVAQKLQQNYKFNTADEIRMRAAYRFLNFTENGRVSYHGRSSANVRMYRVVNNILNKTEKAVADGNVDDVTKIVLDVSQIRGNENLFGETGRKGEIDGLEFLKASGATAEDIAAFAYGNINQMIDDFTPVKALDAVNQFRVMNMLSNIKTALNNILNNAAGMRVGAVSQNIGNLAAREFEKATGKKVAINDRSWKRSKEGIKAEQVAFVNAALMSYYGIQIENGRIELQNGANFRPTGNWFERLGARYSFFVNTFVMNPDQMGKARIDLGIQQGIDEAFEGVEMTPEMQANKKELEGYKEHEKSRRLVQADNATTALVQHFKDYLNKVKVGNDNIGYLRLGDFAMAFAKVPVNIVQQRIAATPYGALYHLLNSAKGFSQAKQMHQDVLEGKAGAKEMSAFDMARYSRDVGRAATTGGMLAIGALAAMTGALKDFGNDDDDDDETRIWRGKGFNGLSLNISAMLRPFSSEWRDGDWVVGADFLEIFAAPLSIGALAWEAHKDGMSVSEAAWYATKRSFTDVLDAIADIPGMQAASQMYEAYTYSTGDGDDLSKTWSAVRQYLANSAASYVMPNLITQTATALDNNVRNPYSADNALQQSYQIFANKIPFLRNTLPVKTDMWGNARTYGDNRFEAFLNKVVLPGQIRKFKTNEYEKEIIRLSRAGYGGLLPNGTTPKKIEVGDNTYSLDSDQSLAFDAAYKDRYTEAYEAFIDSDLYKQLDDPQRQAALKMLRLDVTRQTKQEFLDATGAADDVAMDKWESLGSLEEKFQFVTAKQIASTAWDSEEGTVADYAMMDNFIQNQYGNLSQPVKDVLGNSLTHLDDLYNAYKEEKITSQQWQTCYDIYRQYNAKDEEGHALYKANIANSAQMWAEMQRESGLSDHQMSYIEDNMQMHTIISPNDDQYKEYLTDAGMTREETARTIKAMSELTFMDGYASVQNGQKYHVIVQTVPKEKQWAAFWSIVPGNASKANVAKMRKAQEDGLSFEDALKNNPMGYIYTKTTDSRGKTKKTRIS